MALPFASYRDHKWQIFIIQGKDFYGSIIFFKKVNKIIIHMSCCCSFLYSIEVINLSYALSLVLLLVTRRNRSCRAPGTTRSLDDSDGNENVKKVMGFWLHFSCPPYTTKTWNFLMRRFLEDVNTQRRMFLSLCTIGCGPQEFNSRKIEPAWQARKIHLHLTF